MFKEVISELNNTYVDLTKEEKRGFDDSCVDTAWKGYKKMIYNLLKEEYRNVNFDLEIANKKIKDLENNNLIKRYNELLEEKEELLLLRRQTYIKMKKQEYENCEHLWLIGYDEDFCLKCGLSTHYKFIIDKSDYYRLDLDHRIMHDYLKDKNLYELIHKCGLVTYIHEDNSLVIEMYNKIKDKYSNINDEQIIHYINSAIHNIDKKNKKLERKRFNGFN